MKFLIYIYLTTLTINDTPLNIFCCKNALFCCISFYNSTDHLEDENHSAPHTLLQNLSSYGQRCLGNNRMLFPEHAVTDSRGNSLVGYSEKPTCFTVLSPAGYAVPFSQKNHEYHYRMLVEARKRQSHPNVIKSVSSTTSSSYKLVDRKQHPLNQDVFDRRLEHTASVDHDENRMQKRKNGIDMNDYSLDESTSSCACEPEESQKTCSTVRRAKKAAKSSCVQINDSRIVSSIPITAEWLQSAMGTRDIQITKLPSDIYHCIYQFVTSQSTHEFATKFLRHDHPDVEFIEQLPGMIYLIHMPMDSKRPPKVGIPFRSYSNSHYASFDRSYPVICKVKEWIDKDDRNVTRLYHFYRGNQKRSVNRKRHHPNNDD